VDRDLSIGIIAALLVHSALVWWATALPPRPQAAMVQKDAVVRTVREKVELPKPPAELPKPEEPKPEVVKPDEPKPAVVKSAETPKPQVAKTPAPKSRIPQAKNENKPPPEAPAKNEPAPLQLSKTYGADGPGVVVNAGEQESLGDSAVDPTESNTRRRDDGPARAGSPEGADAPGPGPAKPERRVDIVHAVPKARCKVEWPEGADPGNRIVEVLLSLEILTDGHVGKTRLLKAAGEPFDSAAVAAVLKCAFQPGLRDGKAFVDRVPFAIEFKPNGR
jgi:TonB family protein